MAKMSEQMIYWIIRLDTISAAAFGVALVMGLVTVVTGIVAFAAMLDWITDELKCTLKFMVFIWLTFAWAVSLTCLAAVGCNLIPTTDQAIVIYDVPDDLAEKIRNPEEAGNGEEKSSK